MKQREREKAILLRNKGYSLKEISEILGVAKSSVSLWVREIRLSARAKRRLLSVILKGQFISAERKKEKTLQLNNNLKGLADSETRKLRLEKESEKLLCALLYWCEGNKNYRDGVVFTNSDPKLARLFINLLVRNHGIDKRRISARLHLHEYHQPKKQKLWWAKMLNLPVAQFRKPYMKPHTAKRKRLNYPGCVAIRYGDSIVARKIMYFAQAFINNFKGV